MKLSGARLLVEKIDQAENRELMKGPHNWPLWGESIGDYVSISRRHRVGRTDNWDPGVVLGFQSVSLELECVRSVKVIIWNHLVTCISHSLLPSSHHTPLNRKSRDITWPQCMKKINVRVSPRETGGYWNRTCWLCWLIKSYICYAVSNGAISM